MFFSAENVTSTEEFFDTYSLATIASVRLSWEWIFFPKNISQDNTGVDVLNRATYLAMVYYIWKVFVLLICVAQKVDILKSIAICHNYHCLFYYDIFTVFWWVGAHHRMVNGLILHRASERQDRRYTTQTFLW